MQKSVRPPKKKHEKKEKLPLESLQAQNHTLTLSLPVRQLEKRKEQSKQEQGMAAFEYMKKGLDAQGEPFWDDLSETARQYWINIAQKWEERKQHDRQKQSA